MKRFLKPWLACAALLLGGCVIINSDSHTTFQGRYVSDETLAQVRTGNTQEYVTALIGDPSSRTDLSDGSAVWKWSYTKRVSSKNSVLLLFSGDSSHENQGSVFVEFGPDELVRHTWRD